MDPSDFEKIDKFLQSVGKRDLFEYYSVAQTAPPSEVEAALRKRRGWAQGQQANPRHRQQAMWLIRNNRLLQQALLEQRDAYIAHVHSQSSAEGLAELETFIEGIITVSGGRISARARETIIERGVKLGLSQVQASELLERMVSRAGGQIFGTADYDLDPVMTAEAPFVDYYALLGVEPNATLEELERQHRACYRRARQLQDRDRASELYHLLDQAWRVLSNPEKRRNFDINRSARVGEPQPQTLGLLPPPEGARPTTPPRPVERRRTNAALQQSLGYSAPPPQPSGADLQQETEPGFSARSNPEYGDFASPSAPPPTNPGISRPPVINPPSPSIPGEDDETVTMRLSPAGRPPAPPPGITRSLPYNTSKISKRPRLAIASAEMVQVKVVRKPVSRRVIIKNTGKGRMPGRIISDRDWLEVTRSRLIADATEQEIEVIIHPRKMPRPKSVALVSVITDHGERRAITFRVERRPFLLPLLGGVAAVLAVGLVAQMSGLLDNISSPKENPSAITTLQLTIDPSSDAVLIDGITVDSGDKISLTSGFPLDTPFVLSTELGGFETDERTLILSAGETRREQISLQMTAPLDFVPAASDVQAEIDEEFAKAAIKGREKQLNLCFSSNLMGTMGGQTAELEVLLYLGSKGRLQSFTTGEKNYEDPGGAVEECLTRQLLTVRFPALSGDYFPLEHRFRVPIPK